MENACEKEVKMQNTEVLVVVSDSLLSFPLNGDITWTE